MVQNIGIKTLRLGFQQPINQDWPLKWKNLVDFKCLDTSMARIWLPDNEIHVFSCLFCTSGTKNINILILTFDVRWEFRHC